MKPNMLLVMSFTLLSSCGTYTLKEGQSGAKLLVEAPSLRQVGRMRADSAFIELYENDSNLGYYMLSAHSNNGSFNIPANKLTSIKITQQVAKFGSVAECAVSVKISPKPNEKFKLILGYSQWSSICTADLYGYNGSGYILLSQVEAKDWGGKIIASPR